MKRRLKFSVCLASLLGLGYATAYGKTIPSVNSSEPGIGSLAKRNAPLSFVENNGQVTDQNHNSRSDIQFKMSAANGLNIFIGDGAIHYQFNHAVFSPAEKVKAPAIYDMYRMDVELIGANKHAKVVMEQKQDYYENYCVPGTGENGATVNAYNKITYKDVYDRIDWILYVSNGQLKHEFVIREGGRVADIQLKYGGVSDLKINAAGDLIASTPQGALTENAPCTYQKDGKKINSSFKLDGNRLSYKTGSYKGELIIDPSLDWATYYGGAGVDLGFSVATDGVGNVYMTGYTNSTSDIATSGAYQTVFGTGPFDAFLVKFNSSGVRQWATYYGGSGDDGGLGVTTDGCGNVYMTGHTSSATGIATPGAYQTTLGGGADAFLAKFNSSGMLQWATYYGGSNEDWGAGVATDDKGNVYMTGHTFSTSGIASSCAYQGTIGGTEDAFLVKFNNSGVRKWATYYGGSGGEEGRGVATDGSGNVYMTGMTSSTSGIATAGAYQVAYGGGIFDAFLVKFNESGIRVWGTYFGGNNIDFGNGVATDNTGNVYIAGAFASSSYAFLVKFKGSGVWQWTANYGRFGQGVTTDVFGNVFMTGGTFGDAFLVEYNSSGVRQWDTSYGGTGTDVGQGVAADNDGNVYMAGTTSSTSGIATPGAYQTTVGGGNDAFLAKFNIVLLRKVHVCHHNKSLYVDRSAVAAHLAHGDFLGTCAGDDHGHDCDDDHDHHGRWKSADNDINSMNSADEVKVFPNPSEGIFSIIIPADQSDAEILVTDLAGKVIEARTVTGNEGAPIQFSLGNISAGMYLVKITIGTKTIVVKLVEN